MGSVTLFNLKGNGKAPTLFEAACMKGKVYMLYEGAHRYSYIPYCVVQVDKYVVQHVMLVWCVCNEYSKFLCVDEECPICVWHMVHDARCRWVSETI